jgi:cytochrome P450
MISYAWSLTMGYLDQYDAIPADRPGDKVALVSRWIRTDWKPFFRELREKRPILKTPAFTLVSLHSDVIEVLSRPETFSVRLYAPKMDPVVEGPFMLARDRTPTNWREKSVMRTMLCPEDLPRVRDMAGKFVDEALDEHAKDGRIEVVANIGRLTPVRVCGDYFGFPGPNVESMFRWSRAFQADMFKNIENDPSVHEASLAAGREARDYLRTLLQERRLLIASQAGQKGAQTTPSGTIFDRLLHTQFDPAIPFDDTRIVANMAGLLIGSVETTSQAIVQVIEQILQRQDVRGAALQADRDKDDNKFDALVLEALRFNPINPLVFRFTERTTPLAAGTSRATELPAKTVVFALTASAMFDPAAFPDPDRFDPTRSRDLYLHFGYGDHLCLGQLVATVMISESVKRVLRRPGIRLLPGDEGRIDFKNGPFPESFTVAYDH